MAHDLANLSFGQGQRPSLRRMTEQTEDGSTGEPSKGKPAQNEAQEEPAPPTPAAPPCEWYQKIRDAWLANATYLAAVFGILTVSLIPLVALQTFELHQQNPITNWGNVPEAFAAVGTLLAVVVALWQSTVIRRQAERDATQAADRFTKELDAARELHDEEMAAAKDRHDAELEAQRVLHAEQMQAADARHAAELEAQREIALTQRRYQREQEFKLALNRISRAASAYTYELATLIEETPRIVALSSRQERVDALRPISKKLGALVHDLGNEIQGAHLLTDNDHLHDALDRINITAQNGPISEIAYRNEATYQGQVPSQVPFFQLMDQLPGAITDASRLAAQLLTTGWE